MGEVSPIETRTLLVDGDPISLAGMRKLLVEAKHEVVTAIQGQDALFLLREKQHDVEFQCVFTAMKLPDMCAFEFVEIVEKETGLPIVMISDTYDAATMLRGLSHGAMFCLSKPLGLDDVEGLWRIVKAQKKYLEEQHKPVYQISDHSESWDSQNPPITIDWSLNFDIHTKYGPAFGLQHHAHFMELLHNPYLKHSLKKTLDDALLKWLAEIGSYVNPDMTWTLQGAVPSVGPTAASGSIPSWALASPAESVAPEVESGMLFGEPGSPLFLDDVLEGLMDTD